MKKRYDSYKPSGIDWIGDIPSHWTVCRIKDCFILKTGTTPKGFDKPINDNEINWFTPSDISSSGTILQEADRKLSENLINKEGISLFPQKSLIFVGIGATAGKLGFAEVAGYSNQQITGLIPKTCCSKYYFYYLCHDSKRVRDNASFTTLPIINNSYLSQVYWVMPPLAEQEAIAAWLDEKCEDIDAAIAKVDREIELIDELKQSEISRVVTRGLNPDAPLCPSGIDWIGDIPEHWIICKVKHLVKFNSGDTITSEQFIDNAEFPVYGANGYRGQFDKYNFENQRILIGRVGALCGNVHYTNEKIWCSEHALISSKAFGGLSFDYKWMCLLFESMNLNQYGGGSAQPVIASSVIENLSIILPPLSEQQAIADYLDKKCAEIDGLKAKLIKKRETLTELRQSIISEVVTGKRKII
jgi:type I restriction enzyme S subunit